jgi:hypothetical protein
MQRIWTKSPNQMPLFKGQAETTLMLPTPPPTPPPSMDTVGSQTLDKWLMCMLNIIKPAPRFSQHPSVPTCYSSDS